MVCWRSRSCGYSEDGMAIPSDCLAPPDLEHMSGYRRRRRTSGCPATHTHSMATYIHHEGVCICRHMMYTQEGQDTAGTAWSGMDRMMYVYTSLERCMHR